MILAKAPAVVIYVHLRGAPTTGFFLKLKNLIIINQQYIVGVFEK